MAQPSHLTVSPIHLICRYWSLTDEQIVRLLNLVKEVRYGRAKP